MTDEQRVQKALAIRFDSDAGDGLTLREYFHELLATLWDKDEGFNGKRPFGNSGWQFEIERFIARGLANRDPNEDDGDEDLDKVDDDLVQQCIAAAFVPTAVVPDDPLRTLLNAVEHEVQRARGLFPDPNLLALAHAEEAGELTKAVLEESVEDVRKEAIQAAAMALRLVLDGDPSTDAHRERQGLTALADRQITLHEAADLLNVSPAYIASVFDSGAIRCTGLQSFARKCSRADLMRFKQKRDDERRAGLAEMTRIAQENGEYDAPISPDDT